MKKSTFLSKFQFFSHKIDIFAPKNFASKFTRHYFITGIRYSLIGPKTGDFCIKMLFFTKKKKQHHQKLTLSKTEDISLRKLNISIKNWHFWKWLPFATKMKKILQNWCFCKIFDFTSEAHITKKLTLLKQIAIFFRIDN